jgi:hypothetical protein
MAGCRSCSPGSWSKQATGRARAIFADKGCVGHDRRVDSKSEAGASVLSSSGLRRTPSPSWACYVWAVPWKVDLGEVDWSAAGSAPHGARRVAVILTAVTAVAAVIGSCVAVDRLHPRDRIVSGVRIWHCALVGGSWPVEASALVGLRAGLRIEAIGAVEAGGVWISVARISGPDGTSRKAAFVLGDGAGPRLGGLDHVGREVASRGSSLEVVNYRREVAAASECLDRSLPQRT